VPLLVHARTLSLTNATNRRTRLQKVEEECSQIVSKDQLRP